MNEQIKKELGHFVAAAERTIADLNSKVEFAQYLIKQEGAWAPSFPTSFPSGMLEIQALLAVIGHLQNAESIARVRESNPQHPMPARK